jgi:hypothetical protein
VIRPWSFAFLLACMTGTCIVGAMRGRVNPSFD